VRAGSPIAGIAIAAIVAILLSHVPALGVSVSLSNHPTGRPASCHQRDNSGQAPAPVNHQCCAAGHESAMPAGVFPEPQLFWVSAVEEARMSSIPASSRDTHFFLPRSLGSPGSNPLRI
jgi:hypothetical protein